MQSRALNVTSEDSVTGEVNMARARVSHTNEHFTWVALCPKASLRRSGLFRGSNGASAQFAYAEDGELPVWSMIRDRLPLAIGLYG